MAADSKIERYLAALDRQLQHRRDRADLVDEVGDHLYSAAERWESAGADVAEAESRALAQFGRSELVASLMNVTPAASGGGAAFLSRRLGTLSLAAAVMWLTFGALTVFGLSQHRGFYFDDGWYGVASISMSVAIIVTAVALFALHVRASGEVDDPGMAVMLIGVVAAVLALTLFWLVPLWFALLALIVVWTFSRTLPSPAASRASTIAIVVVVSATAAAFVLLWALSYFLTDGVTAVALVAVPLLSTVAVLTIGFADVAFRSAYRTWRVRTVPA